MNITKCFVEKLKLPPTSMKQKNYYDNSMKGFGIRITSNGVRSFFIEKYANNKVYRATLGQYPILSTENARKKAQDYLGKIAMGINPQEETIDAAIKAITLQTVFADFLSARKNLKSSTIDCYIRIMKIDFADWQSKPVANINKQMITKRHAEIGTISRAHANLAMRLLRAIFTFAGGNYSINGHSILSDNPVKVLSHSRAWYSVSRRTTVISQDDLSIWYRTVLQLNNAETKATIVSDYLLLILFTGLRRQEAAKLEWSNINFANKTLTVVDTKNSLDHTLPLSDFLMELLLGRHVANIANNKYVFAGGGSKEHLTAPDPHIKLIIKISGINFTLHDLRRTFITVAESLDIPAYTLKRLLNHKSQDVTAGYICIDTQRLRIPMQMITDKLLKLINKPLQLTKVNFTNPVAVDFADVLEA